MQYFSQQSLIGHMQHTVREKLRQVAVKLTKSKPWQKHQQTANETEEDEIIEESTCNATILLKGRRVCE